MNISYNWLKQYIDIDLPAEEVGKILTSIGLEVEGIETFETIKGGLKGFVIGEVKTCRRHENADKLSVTTVDVGGDELLPIVCGAPNVAAGQKVVVATVGTTLYSGDESFQIKKAKIRGEVSEGMICAEDEMGIGTSHEGILVLDPLAKVGTPANEYFNISSDEILVIGLTPNRIDAASHYGVARELAAYLAQQGSVTLKKPLIDDFKIDNNNRITDIVVENQKACPRYAGLTITNVTIKPSPEWLQTRLKSIGLNPINNVVDITNFILHELGQPLHAFDADQIKGGRVVVKTLPEGTKFRTLDNVERSLSASDLMICNTEEGMCIGGVFGGIESGVSDETHNIFIESAYFNPVYIRKTSKRHMLNTDASFRFERGTDPNMPIFALKRAAMLIKEVAGGTISSPIIDIYPNPVKEFPVEITYDYIDKLIGKVIDRKIIKNILVNLDITIDEETNEGLKLSVSPYRVDVQRPADVVEEILRIYGYNNVEFSEKVNGTLSYVEKPDKEKVVNTVSDWLSSNGFNEMMANSLTKSGYYDGLETYKPENLVYMLNPLSQDLNVMRQTLLFGGLEAVLHNVNHRNPDVKLYEFGNTYKKEAQNKDQVLPGYTEELHLALFISGAKFAQSWTSKEQPSTFYFLKAYSENILRRVGVNPDKCEITEFSNDIYAEALEYKVGGKTIGTVGVVNKKLLNKFDVKTSVYYADFNWNRVLTLMRSNKVTFEELPRFPEVRRDLSMVLNKEVKFEEIRNVAFKAERKLLKRLNLFDVYEGDKIEQGKKSYAVSFVLQDTEKTLTDQQIDKIMNNIAQSIEKQLGVQIRA
ncbi:MAG: phenylalanine--tRNA ligase subunit beta [Bacteroidota bacterium]|nr:phenylalanine--tRNA ligase subunit beta [Bacteroidota bacterium]